MMWACFAAPDVLHSIRVQAQQQINKRKKDVDELPTERFGGVGCWENRCEEDRVLNLLGIYSFTEETGTPAEGLQVLWDPQFLWELYCFWLLLVLLSRSPAEHQQLKRLRDLIYPSEAGVLPEAAVKESTFGHYPPS